MLTALLEGKFFSVSLTAKRLRPRAQGCRTLAATLGKDGQAIQPQWGCAKPNATQLNRCEKKPTQPLRGWKPIFIYSQGSRQGASTLGSGSQPLRG